MPSAGSTRPAAELLDAATTAPPAQRIAAVEVVAGLGESALAAWQQAAHRLARAINGRGAFRRFKDELHEQYPDLLPAWYAFRDARAARRAVDWLLDESLISDDDADRFRTEHPDPPVP